MGISSPGIGSGLDVTGLVSKLMAAESAPLTNYDTKTGVAQGQIASYNQLSGAISTFQGALTSLSSASTFQALTSTSSNADVLGATTTSDAAPGSYRISVSQLAQAQSLNTPGQASMTAVIGGGANTQLTFEFGSVSGGNFGLSGSALPAATANGIAKGALTINGTTIGTDSTTTSAQALADAINAQSDTTGVTASASTDASAGITLTSTDGSPITIAGSNPSLAGLTAGTGGSYVGAGFSLDGTQTISTVTLGPADQTLSGIRDAINKANIGVTASIVSDGSSTPYHLVLASTKTGANATMKIAVNSTDANPADAALTSLLSYDPSGTQALQQTSAAQDTLVNVNGIAVQSHSTDVTGAIAGVTISATQTGSSTLNVARDTTSVSTAINGFVKAYNTLNSTMAGLTAYNADTKTSGALQGDSTVRTIQTQVRAQLGKAVQGLDGLTTLGQIGISFQQDGSLAVDSTKLNTAMTNNFGDIAGLFAAVGQASDSLVKVAGSSAKTQAGNYGVNITQMATQGAFTSAIGVTGPTTINPNTTWSVTLNQTTPTTASKVQNIAIPAGTYSPDELAAVLRSSINGNPAFASSGDTVGASIDPTTNKLVLSSTKWGSGSNLSLSSVSGSAITNVFGSGAATAGLDVAGTIGGVTGTGNGQTLSGAAGSPTEGLQLSITGGAAGERGDISFSQGYAYQLNALSAGFIGTGGLITSKTTGLNSTIKSIADQKAQFQTHLDAMQKMYTAQFTALDTMMASMQSTQSYLTQQLASIAANG